MSTMIEAVPANFAEARCLDGRVYAVKPMEWDLTKVQEVWDRWKEFDILSDDLPRTIDGFAYFVTSGGALWFEVVDLETDEQVALIYLNELVPSITSGRFISAQFHATAWDAKAAPRLEIAHAFIVKAFRVFGFHRLQCEIPQNFRGAIRNIKNLGFKEEGVLRAARRYHDKWYNVQILGLLEDEVDQWARSSLLNR